MVKNIMGLCQCFNIGGINTTELCTLKCEMCFFHGEKFAHQQNNMKKRTLAKEYVEKFLYEIPKGEYIISFAGLGELFVDPNALYYLRLTKKLGFTPIVTSNGSFLTKDNIDGMLEAGVRTVVVSTDACSEDIYDKMRHKKSGFETILKAIAYLGDQKKKYKDLIVQSNNILMGQHTEYEFVEFWKDKVDIVNVSALMTDAYSYDNIPFSLPKERCECLITPFLLPSGHISPCCTITAASANQEFDWLPNIRNCTTFEAYEKLVGMYYDHKSPLQEHCKKCSSWIRFYPKGNVFIKSVDVRHCTSSDKIDHLNIKNDSEVKAHDYTHELPSIHIFNKKKISVKMVICAHNLVPTETKFYLNKITLMQGSTIVKAWDDFPEKKGIFSLIRRSSTIFEGPFLKSVYPTFNQIFWTSPSFEMDKGCNTFIYEAFSLKGHIGIGFLDASTGKFCMHISPLPVLGKKEEDMHMLFDIISNSK